MLSHVCGIAHLNRTITRPCLYNRRLTAMIGSSYSTQPTEIVYDSEPERLQVREKRRQRKLQISKTNPSEGATMSKPRAGFVQDNDVRSVIELTDSDSSLSVAPIKSGPVASSSAHQYVSDNEDDPAPVKALNINRFAFVDTTCKKAATKPPIKATIAPSKPLRRVPSAQAKNHIEITTSDLSKITRCMCCDTEWTVRKTGVQKLNHIRSCAKKHALDKDTIDILVRNAVANYTPPLQGKGKEKEEPPPTEPLTRATYYEEVLGDAAPKKRTKRKIVGTLLSTPSSNREDILARAQNILTTTFTVTANTTSLREKTPDRDDHFPDRTQQFGTSLLGQAKSKTAKKSLFNEIYSSPPSAHFATLSSPETQQTPTKYLVRDTQYGQGDEADRYQDISPPIDTSFDDGLGDAFKSLVLERLDEQAIFSDSNSGQSKSLLNEENPVFSPSPVKKTPVARKKAAAKTTTPKKSRSAHIFEYEWELYMKNAIMEDDALYIRILRYEPISFNEFLPLAELYVPPCKSAPSGAQLKLALRKYLDDQAIHFYDESWKRR